jgi:nucleoid-associated protein YgaU
MYRILTVALAAVLTMGLVGCPKADQRPMAEPQSDTSVTDVSNSDVMSDQTTTVTPDAPSHAAAGRTHVVQRGDTLFKLARDYYNGDQRQWRTIWDANRDKIPDKDRLPVGVELVIP